MTTNLMNAHKQWAERPSDECYASIDAMIAAAQDKRSKSKEGQMLTKNMHFVPTKDDGIVIRGKVHDATISNLAFKQAATKLGYPIAGLRPDKLPTGMICDILNERVRRSDDKDISGLLLQYGSEVPNIRCIHSDSYTRFWDADVLPHLKDMLSKGWKVPPARPIDNAQPGSHKATKEDVLKLSKAGNGLDIKEGDLIAPAGLFMGPEDMFVLMVDDEQPVDDGNGNPLMRGMFVENSEVATAAFKITTFIMQGVCGNLILWGCQDIVQVSYKHVGEAPKRITDGLNLAKRIEPKRNWDKELGVIQWMNKNKIGNDMDDVVENIYGMRLSPVITKTAIKSAQVNADRYRAMDGDPFTWYGAVNSLTRFSQTLGNANDRMAMDMASGKLFDKAESLMG